MKLKIVFCLSLNVIFLIGLYNSYMDVKRERFIKKNQKPIICNIVELSKMAKASSKCNIEYKSKLYKNIKANVSVLKLGFNDADFYYDEEKDKVFYKVDIIRIVNLFLVGFFISLLLWFIPNNKFTLF
ncbi:hypothetical protein Ga0061079_1401 [Apibacter mensalis]|uniref:Uncharacterized protein n=2 Tax=Apibacter mensalis TaxID=1586267 RepID=A0A0X3AS29_9FLAO|nr:hypothetical protein Ga0061079_1401 [Apibacter mensalis]